MTKLRGITWDHPRGHQPLVAASETYRAATGVEIAWDSRPLRHFEDMPAERLTAEYDLLALDHPSLGDAARDGVVIALDQHLNRTDLVSMESGMVGPSQLSYVVGPNTWAIALDAACMVSATRGPADGRRPSTWREALDLARELGRERVMLPANPTHVYCSVLSLAESIAGGSTRRPDGRPRWWTDDGFDLDLLASAIDLEVELLDACRPESLASDPITTLDLLRAGEIDYVPLVFGYVTYSLGTSEVRFIDAPGGTGTLAGGVGLAVSALRGNVAESVAAAVYLTSESVQTGTFAAHGGQPARSSAWESRVVDDRSNAFFSGTRRTMDRAFLRPRLPGVPLFQVQASRVLHDVVTSRGDARAAAATVNALWGSSVTQ